MSKWFIKQRYSQNPRIRLFMFPYAGAGPSIFKGWQQYFPNEIDVFSVHTPGRESRFKEKPIASLDLLTNQLVSEILPFINVPYIFIGHSNGALTAFHLAYKIQQHESKLPVHLLLSARTPPNSPLRTPPIHNLPDEDFLTELKKLSSTSDDILENSELMDIMIPLLRADFSLGHNHNINPRIRLDCRATILWGQDDPYVLENDIVQWRDYFTPPINIEKMQGGHLFIREEKAAYIKKIFSIINTSQKD